MTIRTEYGARRSTCGCEPCVTNCRFIPGFLIPADLDRIVPADTDVFVWAESNLLASPGSIVVMKGEVIRIPTLVPASKPDGSCINLTDKGMCNIHEVSPFGCAFFDCRMSKKESDPLTSRGLHDIYDSWTHSDMYAMVWLHLFKKGLVRENASVLRERMMRYMVMEGIH